MSWHYWLDISRDVSMTVALVSTWLVVQRLNRRVEHHKDVCEVLTECVGELLDRVNKLENK